MLSINPGMKQMVQRQLEERGTRTPGQPERPVTTVKSKALHDLQFRASVEGHVFISDERESAGGTEVWCVKNAALADVRLENLEGEISGYVARPDSPRKGGFDRATFTVTIDSPNSSDDVKRIVNRASDGCTSFVTFARAARIDVTLIHNGQKIEERSYG